MKRKYKAEYILIIPLIILLPLFSFFCYNLGKFSKLGDTMESTFKQYLPLFPVCVVAGILLFRYITKKHH